MQTRVSLKLDCAKCRGFAKLNTYLLLTIPDSSLSFAILLKGGLYINPCQLSLKCSKGSTQPHSANTDKNQYCSFFVLLSAPQCLALIIH